MEMLRPRGILLPGNALGLELIVRICLSAFMGLPEELERNLEELESAQKGTPAEYVKIWRDNFLTISTYWLTRNAKSKRTLPEDSDPEVSDFEEERPHKLLAKTVNTLVNSRALGLDAETGNALADSVNSNDQEELVRIEKRVGLLLREAGLTRKKPF